MDLASIHHPGQYLIKYSSNLAQNIVAMVLFLPGGININSNRNMHFFWHFRGP